MVLRRLAAGLTYDIDGAPQSLIDQQAAASDPPKQSPFACQNGEN